MPFSRTRPSAVVESWLGSMIAAKKERRLGSPAGARGLGSLAAACGVGSAAAANEERGLGSLPRVLPRVKKECGAGSAAATGSTRGHGEPAAYIATTTCLSSHISASAACWKPKA